MFKDYEEIANKISAILESVVDTNPIFLALSKNAILTTDIVSKNLNIGYDILLQETIFAPNNKECEIAKVSETENIALNSNLIDSFEIQKDLVFKEAKEIYKNIILPQIDEFRKGEQLTNIENRNIVLIDNGVEDGLEIYCAVKSLISKNVKSISLAVGVMAKDIYDILDLALDNIHCVKIISDFVDTNHYIENHENLTDDEIKDILKNSKYFRRMNAKN